MSRSKLFFLSDLAGLLLSLAVSPAWGEPRAAAPSPGDDVRPSEEASFALVDPQKAEQVVTTKSATTVFGAMEPTADSKLQCTLNRGAKGTVVVKRGNLRLVAFDAQDWDNRCGRLRGVDGQRLAWVQADNIKAVRDLKRENYGDICAAHTFLDGKLLPESEPLEATAEPCKDCGKKSAVVSFADQFKEIEKIHFGNRCLIEESADKTGAACSFETMLRQANDCGKTKAGKTIPCSKQECEKRLGKMACQNSPWREKSLEERFNLIIGIGKSYAPKFGIDFRAIPCIATVETGFLEPMAKTLLACGNPGMNRYHGLGMITRQTLEHYISPYMKISLRDGNKKIQIGPFRSAIHGLDKPIYYACPAKLHDILGASPELQVEMMAYTLAEKLASAGGDMNSAAAEHRAYANYNGYGRIDPENGQPHYKNYADAVQTCVSCLRERLPDGGKPANETEGKAVHCLSAAARRETVHPFWLKTDDQIDKVYDGSKKRYCGEDK